MSRGPWKKKKLPAEKSSPVQRGGFYWLVMRKSEAEGFNEETAALRALQELRSQFTTDAEFAACPLLPEIFSYYGSDWKRMIEALFEAGI